MATCLVCSKEFDAEASGFRWNYDGKWYSFNDMGCRNRFIADPAKFLGAKADA